MDLFLLPEHVYLCPTCDGVVFLNLRDDKYIGVGGDELPYLRHWVRGWPLQVTGTEFPELCERGRLLACELLKTGLLTADASQGKSAGPPAIQDGQTSLFDLPQTPQGFSLGMLVRILYTAALIASILKFRSLDAAINRIRRLRNSRAGRGSTLSSARMAALISTFRRVRPLVYSAQNRCLFDCLVLCNILFGCGGFPILIIGVNTFPFKAHCWLQSGPVVLTDYPRITSDYVPILAV